MPINHMNSQSISPIINPQNQTLPEVMERMLRDRKVRTAIVRRSHFFFFNFYFSHYVKYRTAPFHREFFSLTENDELKKIFVVSFRGSSKSSIFTMSYPVWAILGRQEKKFVLILCQTCQQAKQHMANLKRELESNELLKNDLGPFEEEGNEWGSVSLVFSKLNARIMAASSEQNIRGVRHNQYRPDLIIADDLENMASVKTREGRQKIYQWFTGEVIPAGDRDTRIVAVGNLLHEDSLLMRLKEDIEKGRIDGIFKSFPLINDQNEVLWPGKYPTPEDITEERRKVGNDIAWEREYLLRIVSDEGQVIHPDWIHYYDKLPKEDGRFFGIFIGIDLAISQENAADYTSMVFAHVREEGGNRAVFYILPYIINKHLTFPATVELCKQASKNYSNGGRDATLIIENYGYQPALQQQLDSLGVREVIGVNPGNLDKRSRLALTSHLIKTGKILFPKKGCEELLRQLVHFGVEKHDDLADAFSVLINHVEGVGYGKIPPYGMDSF